MPVIKDDQGNIFELYNYPIEDEFERDVVKHANQIFGDSSIYIDIKKRVKGNKIITIPDGYLIDFTDIDEPKLFVIENEIVGHDPFKHIGIQMLKFVTSFEDSQQLVRNFLMEELTKDSNKLHMLQNCVEDSNTRNIDAYIDKAVYGEFRGLVIIDEAREELHAVLRRINANISVLEFKAFTSSEGKWLYQFDTLYDEYVEPLAEKNKNRKIDPALRNARIKRRAKSDTIIVPAREEGFNRVFLGENQWHAIRIGAAMKDKIKHIAAYQTAPISAVTHIAEVEEIKPYKDTGKYQLTFKNPAKEIKAIPINDPKYSPQGPCYVKMDDLLRAKSLDEALSD